MNYLNQLQTQSKNDITKALISAHSKTGLDIIGSDKFIEIINSLKDKFPYLTVKLLLEIIDNGAMGKYGVTYKFTPQLIGSWIYREKYLKAKTDAI